jgi:transposase
MGYRTNLTDKQWSIIEPIFRSNKGRHLAEHSKRDMVNAVLYLVKTGCQWNLLPNDFPPFEAVRSFFRRAVKSGKWEEALDLLVKKTAKARDATLPQAMQSSTLKAQKQLWLLMSEALTAVKKSKGASGIL